MTDPTPMQTRARTRVCGADQGFKNSKVNSPGACVHCQCADPPNGPQCTLYPYSSKCCKPPTSTPHHIIPKHCFYEGSVKQGTRKPGCGKYNHKHAPCVCVEGVDKTKAEHKAIHLKFDAVEDGHSGKGTWTYEQARDAGLDSLDAVPRLKDCQKDCIKAQLDDYHKETCGMKDSKSEPKPQPPTLLKASPYPKAAAAAGNTGSTVSI